MGVVDAALAVFGLLVYPGLIFTAVVGLLLVWEKRKLTARLQARIGPPIYQCFVDFFKLLWKETLIPEEANRSLFILSPILALTAVTLIMLFIPIAGKPFLGFVGDLIVVLYLLTIPPFAAAIGGSSSANPFGGVGASREISLLFAYELPLVLAALTVALDAGTLKLAEIVTAQQNLLYIAKYPLAAIAFFFCIMAKLSWIPFDIPEAKTEIMAGLFTEYSGVLLGIFKLAYAMLAFALPSLFIALFLPVTTGIYGVDVIIHLVLCVVIIGLMSVVATVVPRYRIDQAVSFFIKVAAVLAALDFLRAFAYFVVV
ncbi:MAG: Formate hydrogenlyase subunit HyfC [Candidatus Alkanophagales archaeon MCA70_species_1]|nr:Formate hydrogenlyase subunit HyfC [Candidatus Alkanophaga volatiphilum]